MASCSDAKDAAKDTDATTSTRALLETEKYMAREFVSEKHYRSIHQALASRWDRLHSLSAAMKLMEEYGVKLSPEEEKRLSTMDESQQINALVMKMPQQSNEQFQQFFLQLQLLVSTATRVRRALEEGRPELVEEALNDADSTGISPYILRMAIVQAGSEVAMLKEQYLNWLREVDGKCGRLIRGQEDCRTAQMKLAAAQSQLAQYTTSQNEKAKKVIMNFAMQSDKGLLSSTFGGWKSHVKQAKWENEIRKDYADRIDEAERRLAEYKETRLGKVRGVMTKKAMMNDSAVVQEAFKAWKDEIKDSKDVADNAARIKELEAKLGNLRDAQVENTKKVMMRMSADTDSALMQMVFQAFVAHHQDVQKDKEFENMVGQAEAKIKEFQKNQSEGAKKVLEKMGGTTDTGLIQQSFTGWKDVWEDAKREAEIESIINGQNSKFASFSNRTKDSGMHVMDRARFHFEQAVMLRVLGLWRLETRMEITLKTYQAKIEAKRGQLVGVQHMFRKFAAELESSFKASQDTSRDLRDGPPPGRRLSRNDGTVSLPDISKPGSSRPQKPATPSGRPRH
mmetsp:Transcript_41382/g.95897  ORF Transcript_41382/g.95897 Transcript_41382/m.95897 type:complete len:567 (+) Transcript_41382:68-1768(+)